MATRQFRRKLSKKAQEEIRKALRYGHHGDTFGVDIRVFCKYCYDFVCNTICSNTWYMGYMDPGIDKYCHRITEIGTYDLSGPTHILGSDGMFKEPKPGVKGRSLKIDQATPGLNLFYLPQIMKRNYIPPAKYFSMPKEMRYKFRTKNVKFQNDWMRSKIISEMMYDKNTDQYKGWKYYKKRIDETRKDDVENPQTGKVGYSQDDIFAYQDIIIDIDNHEFPCEYVQTMCDAVAELLINGCDKRGCSLTGCRRDKDGQVTEDNIPLKILPNYVVKTGRGLQLHFLINPVIFTAATMVKRTARALCDQYELFLNKVCPDLEVDRARSENIAGFCRLPGSYNYNATRKGQAGVWGYRVTKHKTIRENSRMPIEDMMRELGLIVYTKEEIAAYKKAEKKMTEKCEAASASVRTVNKVGHTGHGYTTARAERFLNLFNDLAPKIATVGCRNDFLFICASIAREAGRDIYETVSSLNSMLREPLKENEVKKISGSAARKKENNGYHFSTARIAGFLGLTENDLTQYGLTMNGAWIKNEDRDAKRRAKKEARNNRVLELLKEGESVSAVARIMGLCRATVRKIRDTAGIIKETAKKAVKKTVKKTADILKELHENIKKNAKKDEGRKKLGLQYVYDYKCSYKTTPYIVCLIKTLQDALTNGDSELFASIVYENEDAARLLE